MIRCHACILTWFWNIGPVIFFYFMKLSLDMSLFLKSYAGFVFRAASFYPSYLWEEVFDFLHVTFSKMYDLSLPSLSCSYQMLLAYLFQIYKGPSIINSLESEGITKNNFFSFKKNAHFKQGPPQLLLDWFTTFFQRYLVYYNICIQARHIFIGPSKNIWIFL